MNSPSIHRSLQRAALDQNRAGPGHRVDQVHLLRLQHSSVLHAVRLVAVPVRLVRGSAPLYARHGRELPQRHPGDGHQSNRAQLSVRSRVLSDDQRHQRWAGNSRPGRVEEAGQGQSSYHRSIHRADAVRVSIQRRGSGDQRQRATARRYHLL